MFFGFGGVEEGIGVFGRDFGRFFRRFSLDLDFDFSGF